MNEDTNLFLEFDQEIIEGLEKNWQAAVQEGIDYLRLGGKEELSAQELRLPLPLHRGLAPRPRHGSSSASSRIFTGKGDAVRSFIAQYQDVFIRCGWTRFHAQPSLFYRRCDTTGRLQLLLGYVDGITAALGSEDSKPLWDAVKALV